MLKHISILLFAFATHMTWAQTEPVLLTPEDIANDPSLQVFEKENTQKADTITAINKVNNTLGENTQTIVNQLDNTTSHKEIIDINSTRLQDNPELAAIDQKWMDLVKNSNIYDVSTYNIKEFPIADVVVKDFSTEVLKERLAIIDAKTPFHISYNQELERLIKRYLKTRPKALSNLMGKAKYYFPLFEEKLDKYDMPLEIKYLAIVESALRPKARSRVGASGLWQFMYQTGKQYGLNVSSYIDQRQDPILATEAACKYLVDLYAIFDDWDLALAAYNSGPGNVNKAIRRSGGNKNYWNIRPYLPRETASYVPIFYATMYLFEYAEEHNLQASNLYNLHHFEVDSIQVSEQLSFEQIQVKTGIKEDLLEFLNPSYKLNIIPKVKNRQHTLVLPREYIGVFVQNESQIYAYAKAEEAKREKPLPKYFEMDQRVRYRVRSGDYLGRIAERYGVSVKKIKRWNKLRSNKLRIGQRLTIYPRKIPKTQKKSVAKSKSKNKKARKISPTKGKLTLYTVKEGDSFWSISRKYTNISVKQIKDWNGIWSNKLAVGTKLKIYSL